MTYRARKANIGDIENLAKYSRILAQEIERRELDMASLRDSYKKIIENEELGWAFVCIDDTSSSFAGYCYASREWSNWRNGFVLWIELYVLPRYRGNAAALKPLYERLLSEAKKDGQICAIRGYTHNPRAVSNIDLPVVEEVVHLLEKDLKKP